MLYLQPLRFSAADPGGEDDEEIDDWNEEDEGWDPWDDCN